MHVWTHLKPESDGVTGIGLYPDGMVEHDGMVGQLLDKLDEPGIADNTIVVYSTDNGAETISWPDGGITPFLGEKGTTWEGRFRIPLVVLWPSVIKPGSKMNGKDWRVHLDGYNMVPYLFGETEDSPHEEIFYFDQAGNLNAVRVRDWKAHRATLHGGINTAIRETPAWPVMVNLKVNPYERAWEESAMYTRWYAENTMWIFVPIQQRIKQFFSTFADYLLQAGSSLSARNVGYQTLRQQQLLQRLSDVETIVPAARQ